MACVLLENSPLAVELVVQPAEILETVFNTTSGPPAPSILSRLPVEILLGVISFLPTDAAVAFSLVSKRYHSIRRRDLYETLSGDAKAKRRFARLLEMDCPSLIACYCCNILYPWRGPFNQSMCPRHRSRGHLLGGWLCPHHTTIALHHGVVDAFLRGFELGPEYGPPLSALSHQCSGSKSKWLQKDIRTSTEARVARKQLVVRTTYALRVSLSVRVPPQINEFRYLSCPHTYRTLPAIVFEAIGQMPAYRAEQECWSLFNCALCATDFRVNIEVLDPQHIDVRVHVWQCYGRRDHDPNDKMVMALFRPYLFSCREPDLSIPPSRNLERLFEEGQTREQGASATAELSVVEYRQSWLQSSKWDFHRDKISARPPQATPRGRPWFCGSG